MKCLDTDFLIAVLRGKKEAKEKMEALDKEGRHVTTVINVFELLSGARLSKNPSIGLKNVMLLLSRLDVLPLNIESSNIASEIHAKLIKSGEMIEFRDLFIGSIALNRGLPLVTKNIKHFSRIKNLDVERW